ncbi:MAG: twin-arginine translocation signal domain-containing protein, partial [Gammaproteobacteria bacterium]|nr:twin-arginine translocation signal domain-containing protein [Gammaproteobacteria bacterium]
MNRDDDIKFLQRMVVEGSLSRRKFLSAAMAMGVGAMAPALYSEAAHAAPKKGGRLRQGLTGGATSDVLDPGQILDSYMQSLQFGQLRNNLTEVAANGELVGELAESWEANADATQWVFKIRQGVEFHNGKTMNSQDVVDSLQHHLGEKSTSAAAGILTGVDNVKADGKNTVVVSLKGGD